MDNKIVMRCEYASFMDCILLSPHAFKLIGEGFTSFPESKNPKEYTRKYINYKTEISDVIGYAPSVEYAVDCISGDPCVEEIVHIHEHELLGSDTHRDVVNVNLWKGIATYAQTSDEEIVEGKTYYTRSGTAPNYTYTPVTNPSASALGTYYEKTVSTTEFEAHKRTYAVIPNNTGEGTDALVYTGTMKAVSDPVFGKFNTETMTFTANE